MAKVADVQKTVAALAPGDLEKFRAWFKAFEAKRAAIEAKREAKAAKPESLAQQAFKSFGAGRTRNL
jgi:hypothetical protein